MRFLLHHRPPTPHQWICQGRAWLPGLLGVAALAVAPLPAQDFQRFAPKIPPAGERGEVRKSPKDDLDSSDSGAKIELLSSLKGLVFVPAVSDVRVAGRPGVSGVLVENVALMDQTEWAERLAPRIGAPFTMADLNAVMREIILFYREAGRPVVDVVVVEQDITSGVVQLAVVEALLGEVRVEGARFFRAERLAGQVRLKPGGPILSPVLMDDLAWLNRNPFRTVDLVYTPGKDLGETDVVLQVEDRFPMRVYAGYEDSGNQLTGENRWLTGINYGNLWGMDHQINYQWTFTNHVQQLNAHALSYVAPLPWRHTATIFGAYVESEADLPAPFDLGGDSFQLSGRYNVPLPEPSAFPRNALGHELEFGYDFKNSRSNLEFGLIPVLPLDTDIHQFLAAYRASLQDPLGVTAFSISAYFSPGDLDDRNSDAAFQEARADAKASYAYTLLQLDRMTWLPGGFTSVLRGSAQFSNENLLPSEQLRFGGYSSVRGYEESEVNLDEGILLTAELRAPAISLLSLLAIPNPGDELQMIAFWDYASGNNVNLLPGERESITLSSAGPGLRWVIRENFSMRFDYGFQLRDSGQGLGLGDSRMHVGATVSY